MIAKKSINIINTVETTASLNITQRRKVNKPSHKKILSDFVISFSQYLRASKKIAKLHKVSTRVT
jgi:hypothetical protein